YPAAAARFYAAAFAGPGGSSLAEDLAKQYRYRAAGCALLAAAGRGRESASRGEKEKAELRRQALDWLTADLALYRRQVYPTPPQGQAEKNPLAILERLAQEPTGPRAAAVLQVCELLSHWQSNDGLNGVRDPELARLPAVEQQAWHKLWAGAKELRRQA